jgi:mRNA interferase RelE/StbE
MRFQYTRRFQRAYAGLSEPDADRVRKALRLLMTDIGHPGLRVKRIQGTEGIWEARAGLSIRLTFERQADCLILRNVGPHDQTLGKP